MKTDRELLELAAKANGHGIRLHAYHGRWRKYGLDANDMWVEEVWWNPLTDDGDALRLAVKLGFILDIRYTNPMSMKYNEVRFWREGRQASPCECIAFDDMDTEIHAATRRAIVRAAAEIGASL